MKEKITYLLIILIMILIVNVEVYGECDAVLLLKEWFSHNTGAEYYSSIESELCRLFEEAFSLQLPYTLIYKRLLEGSAKNITPAVLLEALQEELVILKELKALLEANEDYFREDLFSPDSTINLYKELSLFLRSGLKFSVIEAILAFASTNKIPREDVFLLYRAFIKIPAVMNITKEELVELGISLLSSDLGASSYSIVSSIYLKASINNISYSEITTMIIESLESGRGLVQVEQEINRSNTRDYRQDKWR